MALGESLLGSLGNLQLQAYGTRVQGGGGKKYAANIRSAANNYAANAMNQYNTFMAPAEAGQKSLLANPSLNQAAIENISNLLGLGVDGMQGALQSLQSTPGYQFALQSATSALQKQMGAQGLGLSGNFANAAQQNAVNLSQQTYNNQVGLLQNYLGQQQQNQSAYNSMLTNKSELAAALQQQLGAAIASSYASW